MGRVIVVVNQKGGVAKTTTVFHVGMALFERSRRVLWVDLDPQAALSAWCGFDEASGSPTLYDALLGRRPAEQILRRSLQGPDFLPSGIELSLGEMELINQMAPERRLARLVNPIRDAYDYVLVDAQPSLGILTQNALVAADGVLIPVACEYLAVRVLSLVMRALRRVRVQSNSRLAVAGILPTLFDGRTVHGRQALEQIRQAFGSRYHVLEPAVPKSVRLAEAAARRCPVWELVPAHPAAEAYRRAAGYLDGDEPRGGGVPAAEEEPGPE